MPENLKNVLLIMSSNGYLVPPSQDPARAELWNETWKRIDRFLPGLRADLALDEPAQEEEPPRSAGLPAAVEAQASEEKAQEVVQEAAGETAGAEV